MISLFIAKLCQANEPTIYCLNPFRNMKKKNRFIYHFPLQENIIFTAKTRTCTAATGHIGAEIASTRSTHVYWHIAACQAWKNSEAEGRAIVMSGLEKLQRLLFKKLQRLLFKNCSFSKDYYSEDINSKDYYSKIVVFPRIIIQKM